MKNKTKNYAIILASGTGSRFGSEVPKQFLKINNKTILELSIEAFENNLEIDEIIVVITPEYKNLAEEILARNTYKKVSKILKGGETRKDSSSIGVSSIEESNANVLIHDCARPLVSQKIITDCIKALETYQAVNVAIPATDTTIEVENNIIKRVLNRSKLMLCQTPQCFRISTIKKAHELAKNDASFTDDCSLVVKYNLSDVYVVDGDVKNIKITYADDIYIAQKILNEKLKEV